MSRKKTLGNTQLFRELNAHTLRTVQKTGLPFYHISEREQQGKTFGERFAHAVQSIYEKGYEAVITVGNDSPQLQSSHIHRVYKAIQEGESALGPAEDGGFYIMGLHRDQFNADSFRRLSWGQSGLLREMLGMLRRLDRHVDLLPVLGDIDSIEDIPGILARGRVLSFSLLRMLKKLGRKRMRIISESLSIPTLCVVSLHRNKGSPFFPV